MSQLPLRLTFIGITMATLLLGCEKSDCKRVKLDLESGKPFEVRWMGSDMSLHSWKEVVVDSEELSIREFEGHALLRSATLNQASISRFKQDILDSGIFEVAPASSDVYVDVGSKKVTITCNNNKFELRVWDLESENPPVLYRQRAAAISRILVAIEDISPQNKR